VEEDTDNKSLLQSSPKSSNLAKGQKISQEQIDRLIHCIVNDNMSITKASQKVNIGRKSAIYYYNVYKNDPEKKIPLPLDQVPKIFTREQIGNLIRYIDTDKMTVTEASAKVNLAHTSSKHYYNRYLKDPNHNIPILRLKQWYT
jgi:response regulator of citrate/malate metabolism